MEKKSILTMDHGTMVSTTLIADFSGTEADGGVAANNLMMQIQSDALRHRNGHKSPARRLRPYRGLRPSAP